MIGAHLIDQFQLKSEPMQLKSGLFDLQNNIIHNDSNALRKSCIEHLNDAPHHIQFAAKIHSSTDVSRSGAQAIIGDSYNSVNDIVKEIKQEMLTALESFNEKSEIVTKTIEILDGKTSRLSERKTGWQCFNRFQAAESYIPPEEYALAEQLEYRRGDRASRAVMVNVTGHFIPL